MQIGNEFRKFIEGSTVTERLCKAVNDVGGLQPEFLAIYMWVNLLVQKYDGTQHIIIDGTPRKYHEAGVLDSIFDFYKLQRPTVVHLQVSNNWSVEHLMKRGRSDDKREEIEARLSWYETEVIPTVGYYKNNPHYEVVEVDGEHSIEEVHKTILEKLSL